jgi:hypothetical protein
MLNDVTILNVSILYSVQEEEEEVVAAEESSSGGGSSGGSGSDDANGSDDNDEIVEPPLPTCAPNEHYDPATNSCVETSTDPNGSPGPISSSVSDSPTTSDVNLFLTL